MLVLRWTLTQKSLAMWENFDDVNKTRLRVLSRDYSAFILDALARPLRVVKGLILKKLEKSYRTYHQLILKIQQYWLFLRALDWRYDLT